MALEEVKFDFVRHKDSNVLLVVCLHHMLHLKFILLL